MKRILIGVAALVMLTMFAGCSGGGGGNNNPTPQPTLVSIDVTPKNQSIAESTTQQLMATGTYSDSTTQDLTGAVTWNSNSTTIATISNAAGSKGLATAVAAGSTLITATMGGVAGSTLLTVNPATLVSISVTPANPSIALSTTKQFVAMGTFSDSTTQDLTGAVTWNSNSTTIATISNAAGSKGLATAAAAGSTLITATMGSVSGTTMLTVNPATLVSISVTPTNPSIALSTTKQFVAMGTFSDSTTQDLTGAVTWNSNSTTIATISNAAGSKGLATAAAAGSTLITATMGSVSGTTMLTVNPATLVSISVTPTNPSIALSTTKQFVAMGTFSDNTTQDLTGAVTWNSNSTNIATISNAAGSKGLATAVAAGSTLITATMGSVSGTTMLTVNPATLVSISVTPTNPSIALSTTKQFAATGTYSDNTTQDLTGAVTWNSNSTNIATISNAAGSKGLATSVAAGSTLITATMGSVSGTTMLTVNPATHISFTVNSEASKIVLNGPNVFVSTARSYDAYLTKFNQSGNMLWENPVLVTSDYDSCPGTGSLNGFVYSFCTQDPSGTGSGIVWLEKTDAATGQKTGVQLSNLGWAIGLTTNTADSTLYACYLGAAADTIVRLDANGGIIGSATDDPSGFLGRFLGYMVAGPDAFYSIGDVMNAGTRTERNRIKIIKYAKDLTSITWQVQYRNFSDSEFVDGPSGAILSPDGKTLYVTGSIDSDLLDPQLANPTNVFLKIDVATGNITATTLGPGLFGFSNLAFDSGGTLYGILEGKVAKINVTTMVVTPLNIAAQFLTLDAVNGRLYVSNGSSVVYVYDLNGNQI